jgi:hypothetical protein
MAHDRCHDCQGIDDPGYTGLDSATAIDLEVAFVTDTSLKTVSRPTKALGTRSTVGGALSARAPGFPATVAAATKARIASALARAWAVPLNLLCPYTHFTSMICA